MSEKHTHRRGTMGGHGHGMGTGEKAKDFKGTMRKLDRYMSAFLNFKCYLLQYLRSAELFLHCGTENSR